MMSSPSITTNGSSPTCLRATDTAWPSPSGSPWRTKWMSARSASSTDLGELAVLPFSRELVLELEVAVEVVLEGPLVAAGDDQDVVDAGGDRLLDHVLDRRAVDDRQHLLRLCLGRRQETRSQPAAGITALRTCG